MRELISILAYQVEYLSQNTAKLQRDGNHEGKGRWLGRCLNINNRRSRRRGGKHR